MNGLESKPSLDFPGIARFIAARTDASGEIGIEEAAQAVIGSARKPGRVCQRCTLPAQPKVRRLQARGGTTDRSSQPQCPGPLQQDCGAHGMSLKIQRPAPRALQI